MAANNVTIKFDAKGCEDWTRQQARAGMKRAADYVAKEAIRRAPRRSGNLVENINPKVSVKGGNAVGYVVIGRDAFYGWLRELGTSRLAAHPFMRPAVYENGAEITRLMKG
jgi:HK97 gp10 family phage protein